MDFSVFAEGAVPVSVAWSLLFATGIAVSFINSVSGGGSILSLTLMLWMGLSSAEANGTNRLGVWFGSLGSAAGFRKNGMFYPRLLLISGLPALIGSLLGALAGVFLPDDVFRPVLGVAMAWIVFENVRPRRAKADASHGDEGIEGVSVLGKQREPTLLSGFWPFVAYAAVGFYGGFLQAGVGLLMMFAFGRLGSLNLLQVNALKAANNLLFATLSIAVFAWFGKIRWDWALIFAAGNLAGGFMGSLIQVKRGEGFIRLFVAITGGAFALKLLADGFIAVF